ncbi:MAG: sigma-54-dependent Fis family transcriptional regulator [Bdellovibrionales bacterium]|nr:sigma-54-dependent Fis family transcriptional regulator [Bdellovibrionales bacterium]
MKKILVVDDETSILEVIRFALEKEGWDVTICANPNEAIEELAKKYFDVLLTDLSMPGMTGFDVLRKVRDVSPGTGVILMTAYGTLSSAIEAMREGAYDFIPKPFEMSQLVLSIDNVFKKVKLQTENRILRKLVSKKNESKKIIGQSQSMTQLLLDLQKIAATDSNVLITGETGTGKELIAREIHFQSPRADQNFIPVNCSAIPENLLESELFGYRKGAFTGADRDKVGLFEACDQGTLFLDEIGEIPFGLQAKLLRVLAEGKFIPLGSTQEKSVNVRVLSATHQNLEKRIVDKQFREDLYYRLKVVEVRMPALRERKEDIELLAHYFLDRKNKQYAKHISGFTQAALEKLQGYHFPGNIRELEHVIEQSIIFEEEEKISDQNIRFYSPQARETSFSSFQTMPLEENLLEYEKKLIQKALSQTSGVKTKAAKVLGISFRSFRYRLKKLGLGDDSD